MEQVIKTGQRGTDAITEARVQSFRRGNNLSAGGLFRGCSNPGNALGQNLPGAFRSESWRHECIRRDQARRQKNIAAVLRLMDIRRSEMESGLTQAQENLMNFLNKLAIAPYSSQLIEEGNQVLDAAITEAQQLQDSIHRVSNALRNVHQAAKLEKGNQ